MSQIKHMSTPAHIPPVLTIDLVSDLVSPWCYLGRKRLDRALARLQGASRPEIRWQPFEINPAIPPQGMEVGRYLETVFGSATAARDVLAELTTVGEGEGIRFDFDGVRNVPNTLDAHRLILLAEEAGHGDRMAKALFRGFFEEGLDIGDREVLTGIASRGGLDTDVVRAYLEGERNRDAVKVREARARGAGLTGVPTLVLNGRVAVLGVQEPDVILSAIDQALFHELPESPEPYQIH